MEVKELNASDGAILQKTRLRALHDCPQAFGSSYEEECHWDKSVYENRITRHEYIYFGAFVENNMIGLIGLTFDQRKKTKHRASVVSFFVDSDFRGLGYGKELLLVTIKKAHSEKDIEQLELSVVTEQTAAVSLYKSMGFEVYGEEPHSLKVEGHYYNEFYMMKILD
jgi:ribosomal protein S18 acetylase RimI-like enzyme